MDFQSKLKEVFKFLFYVRFKTIKNNKNILIYGISRGGTTLLAEALVALFNARFIWEPLFPHRDVKLNAINPYSIGAYKALGLGWSPHSNTCNNTKLNTYFDRLFSLKIRNIRYFRFTDSKSFKTDEFTVFKFCFGNFMYPYFQKRYKAKAIVLLRHPFAIAASCLNFGNHYQWHNDNFKKWQYQDTPTSGSFFKSFEDKYSLIVSPFTLLVFQAVSQFSYLISHLDKSNTTIVFYEDIVVRPKFVFSHLQTFFGQSLDPLVFDKMVKKQSFSSKEGHTKKDALAQLSKWKSVATDKDIDDGLKIFNAFDFQLYSDEIMPVDKPQL